MTLSTTAFVIFLIASVVAVGHLIAKVATTRHQRWMQSLDALASITAEDTSAVGSQEAPDGGDTRERRNCRVMPSRPPSRPRDTWADVGRVRHGPRSP